MFGSGKIEKIPQKRKKGNLSGGRKGEDRKLRKESIKAKRQKEPADFSMPEKSNVIKKPPTNKLKEKLEKEASEIIEGAPKMSVEEAAENLIKSALKNEDIFDEDETSETLTRSSVPAVQNKIKIFKGFGAATVGPDKKNDPIPLGKSSLGERKIGESKVENFSEYEIEVMKIYKEHVEGMVDFIKKLDYVGKFGFEEKDVKDLIKFQIKRFQDGFAQYIIDKNEFSSQEKAEKAFQTITNELGKSVQLEEITEEKDDPVRAAAWHTIHKIEKSPNFTFEDINASTMKEADQKFLDLTRKLWGEFSVHGGDPRINDKGEVYIPCESDLDGESYLKILELAGFSIDRSKVNFVKKGEMPEEGVIGDTSKRNGVVAEEKGKRIIFDHHTPEAARDTSATKYTYETLVKFGLLEKNPELEKFVEFVTKVDSFYFSLDEEKRVYENYSKNLYGLCNRMKPQDILELFKKSSFNPSEKLDDDYLKKYKYFNPAMKREETLFQLAQHIEQKIKSGEKEIDNLEKMGFFVDTGDDRFGKILIDTKKTNGNGNWYPKVDSENHSGQLAIRLRRYGGYLLWSQEENSFILYTNKRMDENSVPGGFIQGENMRGHILVKGFNDPEPLKIKIEDIFSKLAGKKFEFEKKLKEKIETESKGKRIIKLLIQGNLTEDVLKQTAKDSKISLKRLLDEIINQLNYRVKKTFQDEVKKMPKGKDTVIERNRVAIEILLEYQKTKNSKNSQTSQQSAIKSPQEVKTPENPPVKKDQKQEKISSSVKKLTKLFSDFELSYDAVKAEAKNIQVSLAELAVSFIKGNNELSAIYGEREGSIDKQDGNAVEKLAMTIILEDEKNKVEEKIRNEGESDILRIILEEIEVDLFEIKMEAIL